MKIVPYMFTLRDHLHNNKTIMFDNIILYELK